MHRTRTHHRLSRIACLLALPMMLQAAPGDTTRLSVNSSGQQANGASSSADINYDGSRVVFTTEATNLGGNDNNSVSDVYLHQPASGLTRLVSHTASDNNTTGNGQSWRAKISGDGAWVVFESSASDLVGGDDNNVADIFLYNVSTGQILRLSEAGGVSGNGVSRNPDISHDGKRVVFQSASTNLTGGNDTNGVIHDIYLWDATSGNLQIVSRNDAGDQANSASRSPAISPDGTHVAFASTGTNLVPDDTNGQQDIYLRDLASNTTIRVNVHTDGTQSNGLSQNPDVSASGRYVVFESSATNLVDNDFNNQQDVFVHDVVNGTTTLVSVGLDGNAADGFSGSIGISDDGRYVVFHSGASNIVDPDTNGRDVFVRDLLLGQTTRVSISSAGDEANGLSSNGRLSGDGLQVVFESSANNLVANDTNGASDIFLHEIDQSQTGEIVFAHGFEGP